MARAASPKNQILSIVNPRAQTTSSAGTIDVDPELWSGRLFLVFNFQPRGF
jgi:hypothetical protein